VVNEYFQNIFNDPLSKSGTDRLHFRGKVFAGGSWCNLGPKLCQFSL